MATGDAKETKDIPPGTKVVCTTCFDEKIEGEVVAFDYGAKVVIIKSSYSKNAKKNTTDIKMLNMAQMKKLDLVEVSAKPPPSLPALDLEKIDKKIVSSLEQKRRAVEKIGINVTPGAQKLFDTINKTFSDMKWDGAKIVIMGGDVFIDPPYEESCCRGNEKSVSHIAKIVKKHNEEERTGPG